MTVLHPGAADVRMEIVKKLTKGALDTVQRQTGIAHAAHELIISLNTSSY